jgi:hypothetical protein
LKIRTSANAKALPERLNTVLTVLDGNGQPLGYNDDKTGSDSQLIYRMPADGKLCVKVEDHSSWKSEPPLRGDASFTFAILADLLVESASKVHDKEPNDDAAGAQSAGLYVPPLSYLWGNLASESDVDVFKLSVPSSAQFHCEGSTSGEFDGTTIASPIVSVSDATGGTVLARLGRSSFSICVWFEAGTTALLMKIARPTGAAPGANDYYVREWNAGKLMNYGNHYEAEQAAGANDTSSAAEAPPWVRVDATHVDFPVFGRIQQAGDIDYYVIDARLGRCSNSTSGLPGWGQALPRP